MQVYCRRACDCGCSARRECPIHWNTCLCRLGFELASQSKIPRDYRACPCCFFSRLKNVTLSCEDVGFDKKSSISFITAEKRGVLPFFFPTIKNKKTTTHFFFQFFIFFQVLTKWQHGDQRPPRPPFTATGILPLRTAYSLAPQVKPFDRLLGAFPINHVLLCASSLPNQDNFLLLLRASFPQTNNLCAFVSCSQQTLITFCLLLLL